MPSLADRPRLHSQCWQRGRYTLHRKQQARSRPQCRRTYCCASPFERAAADLLIQEYIKEGNRVVATGSGRVAALLTQCLAEQLHQGVLESVSILPASEAAAAEALLAGLPLAELTASSQADLLVYDLDCIDSETWESLAGRSPEGGHQPNLPRLQQIAASAKAFVGVVERSEQIAERLCGWLPVVIETADWERTAEEIDDLMLGVGEVWRRSLVPDANPRGGKQPYESAEGHNILDMRFYQELSLDGQKVPYQELAQAVQDIAGVITTGLLLGPATPSAVLFASSTTKPELLRR